MVGAVPVHLGMKNRYATWRASRGARLPADSYLHRPVHVTICCRGEACPFIQTRLAESLVELLVGDQQTLAYCLMPDHLHWLLNDATSMIRAVQRFKSLATIRARALGWRESIWQRSYYDRVVRSEEDLMAVAWYLVANPVRAGIVGSIDEYPHQGVLVERFGL